MRLSAMGDVAMTVPVLRALVAQHPNVKLTVISRPFYKPFFNDIPNLTFFAFDRQRHKGFLGLFRLYQDLKPLSIDAFAMACATVIGSGSLGFSGAVAYVGLIIITESAMRAISMIFVIMCPSSRTGDSYVVSRLFTSVFLA